MKLKLDENGNVVVLDGKPVYIHDDGKEVAFDAPSTVATITRLNSEAKSHRERAEAAEGKLKGYEGIDDPSAAKKAMELVANLDAKKLVDAGEVEKVKAEIAKGYEAKLAEESAKNHELEQELYSEKVGGSFARSKFIAERLAIPADLAQSHFSKHFKVENGKPVAYDAHGNKIFSAARPGNDADFEEAIEILVSQYPNRDSILKSQGASGGGATPSSGSPNASLKRSEMTAVQKREFLAANGQEAYLKLPK